MAARSASPDSNHTGDGEPIELDDDIVSPGIETTSVEATRSLSPPRRAIHPPMRRESAETTTVAAEAHPRPLSPMRLDPNSTVNKTTASTTADSQAQSFQRPQYTARNSSSSAAYYQPYALPQQQQSYANGAYHPTSYQQSQSHPAPSRPYDSYQAAVPAISTSIGQSSMSPAIAALSTPDPVINTNGSGSTPSQQAQGKRKRKEGHKGKVAGAGGGGGGGATPDALDEDDAEKKRTKTQRACDPCRRKKIRCDVIQDSDPPICQHCKQYRYDCTFFLPISETRFKKKRLEEVAAAAATATNGSPSTNSAKAAARAASVEPTLPHTRELSDALSPRERNGSTTKDVKILGPTSLSFILHSTSSIPSKMFQSYDARYHQTWEVGRSGDGFIKVREFSPPPTPLGGPVDDSKRLANDFPLSKDLLATLINDYFRDIYPQFPVITEAEFLSSPSPPPVLLYSICAVAASMRKVPKEVFEGLRAAVNQIIRADDVLSTASIVNVQALLILGMCGDAHSVGIQDAMTAAWLRLGAAIRMAQDLGLCRAEAVKKTIESRRRIWGACVIADRWYGACFGHPFMIDVLDCDVRLPTPDDPNDASLAKTKPQCYLAEMIKLSILLGKVTKTIYSPSGLVHATDQAITQLLAELDNWKSSLHPDLVYKGPQSIMPAGLLHLFYTCVCMMFWRVFMRLSYSCPAHIKFSLTVERWTELQRWSRDSIEWLDQHESCFDTWMFVAYAASAAALIQYHTWARRRDPEAVKTLKTLRDCVQRWEASLKPGHMGSRRKTAEIVVLLYEATQQLSADTLHNPSEEGRRLNPTVGVSSSSIGTAGFRKLKFTKDPSRPGGGVFIADEKQLVDLVNDVPLGTVVYVEAQDKDGGKATGAGAGQPITASSDDVTSLLVNIAPLPTANSAKPSGNPVGRALFGTTAGGYGGAGWGLGFGSGGADPTSPLSAHVEATAVAGMLGQEYSPSYPNDPHPLNSAPAGLPKEARPQHQMATHPYQSMLMGLGGLTSSRPAPTTSPGDDQQQMELSGNVNPTMNWNYNPPANVNASVNGWSQQANNGGVHVLNLLDQPLEGQVGAYQVLQGIPFDAFAAGWDEYFARVAGPNQLQVLGDAAASAAAAAHAQGQIPSNTGMNSMMNGPKSGGDG